jgi:hypothetical protein
MTMLSDGMLLGEAAAGPLTFISSEGVTGSVPSLSINKPAGAQAGDLVVLLVAHGNLAVSASGFTQQATNASGASRLTVLTRLLDGSEGSAFAVTSSSATKSVIALLYRGGAASVDVAGTPSQVTNATQVAPSVTATQSGILIMASGLTAAGTPTITTPPSGMTQRHTIVGSAGMWIAAFDLSPSPAGATGSKSVVWSSSAAGCAGSMQIY